MTPDRPVRGLAETLAGRSDDELSGLLALRPDLASPPPRGTGVLAQRALSSASIALAGDGLDLLTVAVLEAFLDAGALADRTELIGPVGRDQIVARLGRRARRPAVDARLKLLADQALIWDAGTGTARKPQWVAGIHLPAALPWRAHVLLGPLATEDPSVVESRLDALDDRRRGLLLTLAAGSPLGRSRDAAPDADPQAPVPQLIADGLLSRIDEQTVELVPMAGRLLRGEPPLITADLSEPQPGAAGRFGPDQIDAAGAGEALELLRHADELLTALALSPAAILRSGGLGVRELRRLAKATGLTTARIALLAELLSAARLIDRGFPEPAPDGWNGDEVFAPTVAVDGWRTLGTERRWLSLAQAWLDLPRRPWQVGDTDRDGNTLAALSSELHDAGAAISRRQVFEALAATEPATVVSARELATALAWRRPRQLRRWTDRYVSETLREATDLGLVAHGALTSVGRALLEAAEEADDHPEDEASTAAVLAAMDTALPAPVDHFLVQADLTLMVPGPMTPELAEQVTAVADLESGGAASVYRISEESIRRALDTGRSGAELVELFTTASQTPVPQSLTYLIEDVARRHGRLRVGLASSFVRCEDPATLAEVLRSDAAAELSLRALAPTVAVSPAPVRDVLAALQTAGFAPAGEDSSGALIDLRSRGGRVPARRPPGRPAHRRSRPGPGQLAAVISRMRASDRAEAPRDPDVFASGGGASTPALIQLAIRSGRTLRIGYVDATGVASRHLVSPSAISAGQLVGTAGDDDEPQRFSLHRITAVDVL